jgi:DNA-binding NarL/FixJ family response regulator
MEAHTPKVVLVLARDRASVEPILVELRRMSYVAVWMDACEPALEMIGAVGFALAIVAIEEAADWASCRRIVRAARCPTAVFTRLLSSDRRYRRKAFEMGVTAYVCPPCSRGCLRALLHRVREGDTQIELTQRR